MSSLIETTRTADRITISIPTHDMTEKQVRRLIDLIRYEAIVSKSKLTEDEAMEISRDIKRAWWNKNGPRIEKMIAEAADE